MPKDGRLKPYQLLIRDFASIPWGLKATSHVLDLVGPTEVVPLLQSLATRGLRTRAYYKPLYKLSNL